MLQLLWRRYQKFVSGFVCVVCLRLCLASSPQGCRFYTCHIRCLPCALSPAPLPLLSPSLSHRSVVCHLPWPQGCQLCLIASAAAATLCSANKLHFDFRFPLATCHTTAHRSPAAPCFLPHATCHRGPSGGRRSALCKCLSPLESLEIRPGKCAQAQK